MSSFTWVGDRTFNAYLFMMPTVQSHSFGETLPNYLPSDRLPSALIAHAFQLRVVGYISFAIWGLVLAAFWVETHVCSFFTVLHK
jgi:hypothetical protein